MNLDSKDLFCWFKWKKWFLWIMAGAQAAENHEDGEAWPDTYNEWFMHHFQPEPTHKVQ